METKDFIQRILEEKVKKHKNFKLITNSVIEKSNYISDKYVGLEADYILSAKLVNPYLRKKELRQICIIINSEEVKNYHRQFDSELIDAIFFINDVDYMFEALEEIENLMDYEWIEANNLITQERKAHDYLSKFWIELIDRTTKHEENIISSIPPLINFYDERPLIIDAVNVGSNNIVGGYSFSTKKKNHVGINIALNPRKNIDKKIIRHEAIHYLLNLKQYGNRDDDLAFWCYCKIFKGGAYKKLSSDKVPVYEKFISAHTELMSMQENISTPINILELELFTFFKDYYEYEMDADEACKAIDKKKIYINEIIEFTNKFYEKQKK